MLINSKTSIKGSLAQRSAKKKVIPVVSIKEAIPDVTAENRRERLIKLLTRFK